MTPPLYVGRCIFFLFWLHRQSLCKVMKSVSNKPLPSLIMEDYWVVQIIIVQLHGVITISPSCNLAGLFVSEILQTKPAYLDTMWSENYLGKFTSANSTSQLTPSRAKQVRSQKNKKAWSGIISDLGGWTGMSQFAS